jgi:phosphoribosyl-ATP pyrophosphohydrolase
MTDTLSRLEATIRARRAGDPGASYVAALAAKGRGTMARKLGEEAVEAVVAALEGDRENLVKEGADILFHLIVLLADLDVSIDEVLAELDRRDGVSGLAEKAARGQRDAG